MVGDARRMTPDEFRAALKDVGISQAEYARRIDVNKDTMNRWATGRLTPIPRYAIYPLELLIAIKRLKDEAGL